MHEQRTFFWEKLIINNLQVASIARLKSNYISSFEKKWTMHKKNNRHASPQLPSPNCMELGLKLNTIVHRQQVFQYIINIQA